jgi:hypothetical protein
MDETIEDEAVEDAAVEDDAVEDDAVEDEAEAIRLAPRSSGRTGPEVGR